MNSYGQVRRDGVLSKRKIMNRGTLYSDPSHYKYALEKPLSYNGGEARIPDLLTYPTTTSTLQLEVTQTINANGCIGGYLVLYSGGPRYVAEAGTSVDSGFTYLSTAAVANNTWTGFTATTGNTLIPGAASLLTIYNAYRVVSAGVLVEFIGNDSNNQGQISGAFLTSADTSDNNGSNFTTQPALENFRHNYTGAAKNGIALKYLPLDVEDLKFGNAGSLSPIFFSRNFVTGSGAQIDMKNYGTLQWHATGCAIPPVGSSFRVTIRVHVEGIVSAEYAGTDDGKTCIKPEVLAKTLESEAKKPRVQAGTRESDMSGKASGSSRLFSEAL